MCKQNTKTNEKSKQAKKKIKITNKKQKQRKNRSTLGVYDCASLKFNKNLLLSCERACVCMYAICMCCNKL